MRTSKAAWLLCFLCGCQAPHALSFSDGGLDLTDQPAEFGQVALSRSATRELRLRNHGDAVVRLRPIALDAGGGFRIEDNGCESATLDPGASCALTIVFSPVLEGVHNVKLSVTSNDGAVSAIAILRGTGLLDCSLSEELTTSRGKGGDAAVADNAADADRGRVAGEALTYDDGYRAGWQGAHDAGYSDGYHDPIEGYDRGYGDGYARGQAAGLADLSACSAGQSDGGANGSAEGIAAGGSDGYAQGYDDGYNTGYADGAAACGAYAKAPEAKKHKPARDVPADPQLVSACYAQGYAAARKTDAYAAAYATASAHNASYQAGLTAGNGDGYASGHADGVLHGRSDGDQDGYDAGYAAGAQQRYQDCYDAAYPAAFDAGYASGRNGGYDAGFGDGGTDGYADGYAAYCPY